MPLTIDERGLLPLGVHDASIVEIEEQFGRFQSTDRRCRLFARLREFVAAVNRTGWDCTIFVDGSFVMQAVDQPDDVDVLLVLPADWDMGADLKPFQYNVVSNRFTKKEYEVDVFTGPHGSRTTTEILQYFQQVKADRCRALGWPLGTPKGIVRLVP